MTYNEATKKSQGDNNYEMTKNPTLVAKPNSPRKCPIASNKLYMSKLTKIDAFFRQPNPYYKWKTDFFVHITTSWS